MADIALRQLQLIELLACNRYGATLERMQEATRDLGIDISNRTLERDLQEIADVLPVRTLRDDIRDGRHVWLLEQHAANNQYLHQKRHAANDSHWHPIDHKAE